MVSYLEDTPRRAAVDPQRLVQCSVERGALIAQLLPQLLLFLSIDEEGGWRVDALLPCPGSAAGPLEPVGAAWDEKASTPCLEPPATMWSSRRMTSAPA
jgi:hypothetical protein